MEEGAVRTSTAGSPQGGVISPLLANVYLDDFDRTFEATCGHLGQLVRYADDFVVLCRTKVQAEQAMRRVREIMSSLRLELHPTKTKLVELGLGKKGFEFLGCYLRIVQSHFKRRRYLFRWPARQAMNSVRTKIRELTDRRRCARVKDVREIIARLNPILRGWGNYFRTGNASARFQAIDRYVRLRLCRVMQRRGGQRRANFRLADWPHYRFVEEHGLHKLLGTIQYPGGTHAA